jgi:dimethylargininase
MRIITTASSDTWRTDIPAGMTRYTYAIVRVPSPSLSDGLTTASLGRPDYGKAREQHNRYVKTLRDLGLEVKVLDQAIEYPDSTFVEDVALCTKDFAVVTRPGAITRTGETEGMRRVLEEYFDRVYEITPPGTLEAGDVMMAGSHFFIGLSARTNSEGAQQLTDILGNHGLSGSTILLRNLLHLKSGASYLENNNMLVTGELSECRDFEAFNRIVISKGESYAANSLWINGTVLVAEGFPETRYRIEKAGYNTVELDMSEYRKVDGGLSCLSLRF